MVSCGSAHRQARRKDAPGMVARGSVDYFPDHTLMRNGATMPRKMEGCRSLTGCRIPSHEGSEMTSEEQRQHISDCCDGFKRQLLAKADRMPRDSDCAEIQQWIMDTAREAWTIKMTPARGRRYQMAKQVRRL